VDFQQSNLGVFWWAIQTALWSPSHSSPPSCSLFYLLAIFIWLLWERNMQREPDQEHSHRWENKTKLPRAKKRAQMMRSCGCCHTNTHIRITHTHTGRHTHTYTTHTHTQHTLSLTKVHAHAPSHVLSHQHTHTRELTEAWGPGRMRARQALAPQLF
jgi:hypothetical protein